VISPLEPFDWRDRFSLKVKNQHLTSSCVSQAITTVLEAYFKRTQQHDGSWSALDLYYCGLNPEVRLLPGAAFAALKSDVTHFLKSSECPHVKSLHFLMKAACSLRGLCKAPSAKIQNYHQIRGASTDFIKKEIVKHGPLVGTINWTTAIEAFLKFGKEAAYREKDWEQYITPDSGWHAVTVLGWNFDSQENLYWIIQNSYGKNLGDNGVFHLYEKEAELLQNDFFSITKATLVTAS
jgi:hypothetical protein